MAQVICIVNQKGGVGKTTTTINLGAGLAAEGKSVLVIDLDPQANATSGLGVDHRNVPGSIYNVLSGEQSINDITHSTRHPAFKLAPAHVDLAGAAVELIEAENREFLLQRSIEQIRNLYDYILIDCPPSLGLLTVNGLTAADTILIPVQSEYFALEGLGQLIETIDLVREHLKPNLGILGAVITMFDSRNKLSKDVLAELYKYFSNRIFRSVIPRTVKLAEAPSYGKTIFEHDPGGKGAKAYERLAREIIEETSI